MVATWTVDDNPEIRPININNLTDDEILIICMAAINKIYVNSYDKYITFKNWCEKQPPIVDKYGTKYRISDYLITGWSKEHFKTHPVFRAPYFVDSYVIKNCPFDFIQKELKCNYDFTYEAIKEGKL